MNDTQLSLEEAATEEFKLQGYPNPIKIKRDANGTPHISARTENEGYGALCYAIATDRLFQLDFLRRVGQGRLAERLGSGPDGSVLQSDRVARVINIPRIASDRFNSMSKSSKDLFKACSVGINMVIERAIQKKTLPLEFYDLGYEPDKWKPEDSLAISIGVAMNLDTGIYLTKVQISAISFLLSPDIAAALVPVPPTLSMFDNKGKLNPPSQFITGPGKGGRKKPSKLVDSPRLRRGWRAPERRSTGLGEGAGPESNNYAVDGALTKTGRPMVANDPHLPLTVPSLAYAAQLQVDSDANGKRMNVEGVTFPGFPTFVSGRTDTSAWAVTFMLLDDVDLYRENIQGQEVLIDGTWHKVETRDETILVAGEPSETIKVTVTPHGPVLNAAYPELDGFGAPIALKSTTAQPEWSIEGLINLPRTNNWADFKKSARSSGIGFNFLYSDETGGKGRIGYQASGLVPLRESQDNAFVIVSGEDGNHEWTGYAKPGELPSVYDPPSHALATGNNRIVPDDYAPDGRPIYLSNYYDVPWRTQRLYTRLLKGSPTFNAADFAAIQLDTLSVVNIPLRDMLVNALKRVGLPADDPSAKAAFEALQKWDGKADATSRGAAVFETLLFVLQRNTVIGALREYAPDLYPGYASSVFITQQQQAVRDLLETPRYPFFGATSDADAPAARDRAVSVALAQADALLRGALGTDVSKWTWGGVHTLTYNHPLAALDPNFIIGTFPANGDASTPWIGGFFLHAGYLALPPEQLAAVGGLQAALAQDALQVVRAVWEPSVKTRSLLTLSTGQSGDPQTSHYKDQAKAWREGKFLQLPYFQ